MDILDRLVSGMTTFRVYLLLGTLSVQVIAIPTERLNGTSSGSPTVETTHNGTNDKPLENAPYFAAAVHMNCSLTVDDKTIPLKIKNALDEGAKMIKYYININDEVDVQYNITGSESNLYRPFFWVRARDSDGTALLHLRTEYDVLSLSTLEIDVETMKINLTEIPTNCLRTLSYTATERLIRELVMNDFNDPTATNHLAVFNTTDRICNMHILDSNGEADFRYFCCHNNASRDDAREIICNYLEPDTWLNMLLTLIFVLKVLVVIFSPNLIPKSFYSLHIDSRYTYTTSLDKPQTIKALMTRNPERYTNVKNKFKLSAFKKMMKFKSVLNKMYKTQDFPTLLTLNNVQLRVKHGCLLAGNSKPVGLFKTMFQSIVKCKIREEPDMNECFNTNALLCSKCHLTWYLLLKRFMAGIFLLVLTVPWIIRSYFYFRYEHEEIEMRQHVATEKALKLEWPGNFVLLLTPLHALFIAIYSILVIESCVLGIMIKKMKEQFRFVLRKCFHDMHHVNISGFFTEAVRVFFFPCKRFGCLGILIGLFVWPIYLIVIVLFLPFYLLPTLNITLQLFIYFAHFLLYLLPEEYCRKMTCFLKISKLLDMIEEDMVMKDFENVDKLDASVIKSKWKILRQLVVILMCLVSLYSVIFLMMEFISFFVEMLVYTLIGLILNADSTLTYASLVVLLAVYAYECFDFVNKKYESFNSTLNEAVLELVKEKIENKKTQTHAAFRVKLDLEAGDDTPVEMTTDEDGVPGWQFSRLLLFMGKNNQPNIPKTFFFKTCDMPFYSVPKSLFLNYLKAAADFIKIILFLMFVLVVVLAFGNAYEISATNKMLVAVAGGMLPFLLQNFVFKSHTVQAVDKDNTHFQICLQNLISDYKQIWPVYDIDAEDVQDAINSNGASRSIVAANGSLSHNSNNVQPAKPACPKLEKFAPSEAGICSDMEISVSCEPESTCLMSVSTSSSSSKSKTSMPQSGSDAGETDPLFSGNGHGPYISVNDSEIDLLIYVSGNIDEEDFPDMV